MTLAQALISALAFIARFLPEIPFASLIARALFWGATGFAAAAGLAAIYRYGPARDAPPWREVAPGAVLASLVWLAASALFSVYLCRFDGLGWVYGSLAAIVLLQFWLLVTALTFLLGARFNLEYAATRPG